RPTEWAEKCPRPESACSASCVLRPEETACRTQDSGRSTGAQRRHPQIHQLDPHLFRHFFRSLVAIELAVVDLADARVGDQLEAVPAGGGGRVQLSSV